MKKYIASISLFVLLSHFPLLGQHNSSNNFWIPTTDKKKMVSGEKITINSKGVILVLNNYTTNAGLVRSYLYRSADNGKTWRDIAPSIPVFDTYYDQNYADRENKKITAICVVDSVFFITTQKILNEGFRLLRSFDNGKSWELINDSVLNGSLNANNKNLIIDEEYYTAANSSFLAGNRTAVIYESEDFGKTFNQVFYGTVSDSLFPIKIYDTNGDLFLNNHKITPLKYGKRYWFREGEDNIYTAKGADYEGMWVKLFDLDKAYLGPSGSIYINFQIDYESLPEEGIYKSIDGGKVFKKINHSALRGVFSIKMISCIGNIYISGYRKDSKTDDRSTHDIIAGVRPDYINSSFRTTDDGDSWQELHGLDAHILDMALAPDGTVFVVTGNGVYKSAEKECWSHPTGEENLNYGTTVITHGYQYDGNFPPGYKTWIDRLSLEILKKAGEGCIYRYDTKQREFTKLIELGQSGQGEQILLFNWAENSNNPSKGFSEAAADELFAALVLGNYNKNFGLDSIHFIGHSRGTVVNSLAVERLLILKRNYSLKFQGDNRLNVDHVTNLSPHDWGIGVSWDDIAPFESEYISTNNYGYIFSDLDDAHPDIVVPFPNDYFPNNGTISWKGIFSDTYWQKNGKIEPLVNGESNPLIIDLIAEAMSRGKDLRVKAVGLIIDYINKNFKLLPDNLNDRSVWNTQNHEWNKDNNGHSTTHADATGIHQLYAKTVNEFSSFEDGGYFLSRLSKGESERKQSSFGFADPTFDFYEKLIVNNDRIKVSRIRGVCNGSFDRGIAGDIPGWHFTKGTGLLNLQQYVDLFPSLFDEAIGIRHNPMYIPIDAKSIDFKIMAGNVKYGSLLVIIKSLADNEIHTTSFPIDADIVSFVDRVVDIPQNFRDKVVTIEFLFSGKPFDSNKGMVPTFQLDEVNLVKD